MLSVAKRNSGNSYYLAQLLLICFEIHAWELRAKMACFLPQAWVLCASAPVPCGHAHMFSPFRSQGHGIFCVSFGCEREE